MTDRQRRREQFIVGDCAFYAVITTIVMTFLWCLASGLATALAEDARDQKAEQELAAKRAVIHQRVVEKFRK